MTHGHGGPDHTVGVVLFSDRIAAAHISAPFCAGRFGLDSAEQHKAAALTVELFRDRARFADPTFFVCDGCTYIVQRSDDDLFVLARP